MTEYEIIGGDGKEYGPYPAEKIRGLLRENRLKPYSKIRPTHGGLDNRRGAAGIRATTSYRIGPAPHTTYRRHGCTLQSSTTHSPGEPRAPGRAAK